MTKDDHTFLWRIYLGLAAYYWIKARHHDAPAAAPAPAVETTEQEPA